MIPHEKLTLPMGNTRQAVDSRAALIQSAILHALQCPDGCTAIEMADAFGIAGDLVRSHLRILSSDGVIRRGPLQAYTQAILWQLVGSAVPDDVDQVRRAIVPATQTTGARRDALVAALFGPAGTVREVRA